MLVTFNNVTQMFVFNAYLNETELKHKQGKIHEVKDVICLDR